MLFFSCLNLLVRQGLLGYYLKNLYGQLNDINRIRAQSHDISRSYNVNHIMDWKRQWLYTVAELNYQSVGPHFTNKDLYQSQYGLQIVEWNNLSVFKQNASQLKFGNW